MYKLKGPFDFEEVPKDIWPNVCERRLKVLISKKFLVQIYIDNDHIRITVNKVKNIGTSKYPKWEEGITWDDLQHIKNTVGYEKYWCVECFPPSEKVVNVANMRHLWVIANEPEFGWKSN